MMVPRLRTRLGLSFALEWAIANALGFMIAGRMLVPYGGLVALVVGSLFGIILGAAASGVLIGAVVGVAQWLIMLRYLKNPAWWILTDVIGWAITAIPLGVLIFTGAIRLSIEVRPDGQPVLWAVLGAIFGLTSGIFQLPILPLPERKASLWLTLNALGWAFALTAGWLSALAPGLVPSFAAGPLNLLSGLIGGALMSGVMLWLLRDVSLAASTPDQTLPERTTEQGAPFRFTAKDRLGGIGLFGSLIGLLVLATERTTPGILILALSVSLFVYAIAGKRVRQD